MGGAIALPLVLESRKVKIDFFNPFTLSGLSTTTVWTGLFPIVGCLVSLYYYYVI